MTVTGCPTENSITETNYSLKHPSSRDTAHYNPTVVSAARDARAPRREALQVQLRKALQTSSLVSPPALERALDK